MADVLRRFHFYMERKLLGLLDDGSRAAAEQFSDTSERGTYVMQHCVSSQRR